VFMSRERAVHNCQLFPGIFSALDDLTIRLLERKVGRLEQDASAIAGSIADLLSTYKVLSGLCSLVPRLLVDNIHGVILHPPSKKRLVREVYLY
jgi:hypothetical protein